MRNHNWAWFIAAAAVVGAIGWGLAPRPILVESVTVSRGPLQVTIEEEGKTRVMDRFLISAPVAGFARRLELDVGDRVTSGQVLLFVDPLQSGVLDRRSRAEARARVSAAEAALRAAEETVAATSADARYWEAELARIRQLHESETISQDELDQGEAAARKANASFRSSQFQVDVARHELEAARTALRYSAAEGAGPPTESVAIRSPVDGSVLKIIHESEGVVQEAEPLLEVGNPRALEVEVEVLSSHAVQIKPGMPVIFERWGGDNPLQGQVRTVEPVAFTKVSALGVEEQRVHVIVDITSDAAEWESLGDQYRVEAKFLVWEGEEILQVPSSALFRHEGGWAVFLVDGGQARLQPVELGHRAGLTAEIRSGVEEGAEVVAHPSDAIEEGTAVQVH